MTLAFRLYTTTPFNSKLNSKLHGEKRATREYCENRSNGGQQGKREHQRCGQIKQSTEANGGVQVRWIEPNRDRELPSRGGDQGKSSVVQMERVDTSHL